ncbi:beta-lactamase/transpeptidase-like protein [Xylariaceae sp. FL1272]|nr:beta-lactamase/transpeptidase-like protein [Xylariaceae sp. FL1272]
MLPLGLRAAAFFVTLVLTSKAFAVPNCPFQGPAFPQPTNLAASPIIQTAIQNLTAAFDLYDTTARNNPNGTSWSLQIFAASTDEPVWEHYHTAANLKNAQSTENVSVGADTIYRLGSLTKIFNIMTFLAEGGEEHWMSPATRYVPELQLLAEKAQSDPILNVDWEGVTLSSLASHTAGIMRDYAIEGELTQEHYQAELLAQGFPPKPAGMVPSCGEYYICDRAARTETFSGVANIPPSFSPSQTPAYSNLGYQLLAYALEGITNKTFAEMLQTDIIDKLDLNHTYYRTVPPNSLGVIPPGTENGWNHSLGDASPTGNMYSSVSDLATLGRAIFRHTILTAAQTRRWLKPAATTADIYEGISYPWGYRRIPLGAPGTGLENRIVDAYSKAGSITAYAALLVLLPDYDVGFTALLAGGWPGNANWDMADVIGPILIPALEAAARDQAQDNYGGTYTATSEMNSSLSLFTDPSKPGIGIDRWISNGTDMIPIAIRYTLNYNVTGPSLRLFPTGLETTNSDGTKRIAFKAMIENTDVPDRRDSMFSTNCGTWVSQTAAVYADYPLDQFVFTLGPDGRATGVEPLALRIDLGRDG